VVAVSLKKKAIFAGLSSRKAPLSGSIQRTNCITPARGGPGRSSGPPRDDEQERIREQDLTVRPSRVCLPKAVAIAIEKRAALVARERLQKSDTWHPDRAVTRRRVSTLCCPSRPAP